jgi:hypothetical protein
MAEITQLALKKIDLIFPNEHVLAERLFVNRFIVDPMPSIIYNPGLDREMLVEFSSRCDLLGIPIVGFEFKDKDMIPIESHSFEEYCKEYTWEWVKYALSMNPYVNYGSLIFPVVDISPEIIHAYLCA